MAPFHNDVTIEWQRKQRRDSLYPGQSGGLRSGHVRRGPRLSGGIQSALLPWESVQSRTFQWKERRPFSSRRKDRYAEGAPARRATTAASAAGRPQHLPSQAADCRNARSRLRSLPQGSRCGHSQATLRSGDGRGRRFPHGARARARSRSRRLRPRLSRRARPPTSPLA